MNVLYYPQQQCLNNNSPTDQGFEWIEVANFCNETFDVNYDFNNLKKYI